MSTFCLRSCWENNLHLSLWRRNIPTHPLPVGHTCGYQMEESTDCKEQDLSHEQHLGIRRFTRKVHQKRGKSRTTPVSSCSGEKLFLLIPEWCAQRKHQENKLFQYREQRGRPMGHEIITGVTLLLSFVVCLFVFGSVSLILMIWLLNRLLWFLLYFKMIRCLEHYLVVKR